MFTFACVVVDPETRTAVAVWKATAKPSQVVFCVIFGKQIDSDVTAASITAAGRCYSSRRRWRSTSRDKSHPTRPWVKQRCVGSWYVYLMGRKQLAHGTQSENEKQEKILERVCFVYACTFRPRQQHAPVRRTQGPARIEPVSHRRAANVMGRAWRGREF